MFAGVFAGASAGAAAEEAAEEATEEAVAARDDLAGDAGAEGEFAVVNFAVVNIFDVIISAVVVGVFARVFAGESRTGPTQ